MDTAPITGRENNVKPRVYTEQNTLDTQQDSRLNCPTKYIIMLVIRQQVVGWFTNTILLIFKFVTFIFKIFLKLI